MCFIMIKLLLYIHSATATIIKSGGQFELRFPWTLSTPINIDKMMEPRDLLGWETMIKKKGESNAERKEEALTGNRTGISVRKLHARVLLLLALSDMIML